MSYEQTVATPAIDSPPIGRTWRPTRAPEVEYDWRVPFRRSQTTAMIIGLMIGFLVTVINVKFRNLWSIEIVEQTLFWSIGTFLLVWLLAWFRESKIVQGTLYVIEDFMGLDLNRDGMQGKPGTRYVLVRGNKQQEISSKEDQLVQFVRGCFERGPSGKERTGMDHWASRGMNRAQYEEFRDLLDRAGYIKAKGISKRAGWIFKSGLTSDDVIEGLFSNQ